MTTLVSSRSAFAPHFDGEERFDALVRLRFQADRRTLEARRLGRAMIWFAGLWSLVPLMECLLSTAVSPVMVALHFGMVIPWALLIGSRADGRRSALPAEVQAGSVALMAVAATLIGHRVGAAREERAFDLVAVLPLLSLCLFVRPGRVVATAVAGIGLALLWGAAISSGDLAPAVLGPLAVASAVVLIALVAGQTVEGALRREHMGRLRSDLAAHRLTHRNDELKVLSEVDTLTGLANRRSIDLRLPEISEQSSSEGEVVAVMMIDVDHFKSFNDRFGHQEGDRCLVAVARAASDQIRRKDDLIGRFGGEEFLAVLPGAGLDAVMRVAERIRVAIERLEIPQAGGRAGRVVTVSIGCSAGVVSAQHTIDDLLRAADAELYAAKRAGRNRVAPLDLHAETAPCDAFDPSEIAPGGRALSSAA